MREPLVVGLVGCLLFGLFGCSAEESSVASTPTAAAAAANTNIAATAKASAAPLKPAEKDKRVPPPEGMAHIPAGIFLMGAPHLRGNPEEKPAHEAIVASFFLDKYEVTHGAFMKCVKAGSCKVPRLDHMYCNVKLQLKGATDRDKYPANCIDLMNADSYCRWAGKRLPTEREWEYAATGGDRRTYSWGEELPTKANCCYNNPGSCVGGSFEAGAFGLYDMTGNVWEWTSSQFLPYPSPPRDETLSRYRRYVYRGGSWSRRFPKWMRTLLRNRYKPDDFSASVGVRCAQTITPLVCPANSEAKGGICLRVRGEVRCEPGFSFRDEACRIDGGNRATAPPPNTWRRAKPSTAPQGSQPRESAATSAAPASSQPTFSRSRTAHHDRDCKRNWPATPASYIFRGGKTYPSRKSTVAAAGCVPRDMGATWTSACCRQ